MPSPEAMFFSSPPSAYRQNPADEVPQLVGKAQMAVLSPAISACLRNPEQKRLFLEVFARHVELLKSRSQAFEDGHITVYDKALLSLTHNGHDLESPHAIQYFCEDFLGIDTSGDPQTARKALETSTRIRGTLEQACRTARSPTSLKIEPSIEQPYPTASPDMEPKLTNLWSVYQRAKADYLVVANDMTHTTARAARFLRDTAENILSYLQNKTTDPIMIAELDATYRMAKEAAVSLTGGKKRKFDVGETDRGMGARRGYGSLPIRTKYRGGQRCGGQRYGGSMRRSRSPPVGSSSGHYGHGGAPGYPVVTQPPRGPSGIPFGYTRPVDSYHPY